MFDHYLPSVGIGLPPVALPADCPFHTPRVKHAMAIPGMGSALKARGVRVFPGGNQSFGSVLEFCQELAKYAPTIGPQAGGTLTLNGAAVGSYDYVIKEGPITVSSFVEAEWFTSTADSRSAFVVVKGDLTISAGQTLRPANRKLFVAIYVTGNLSVAGSISMSQRGANHSAAGSNIAAAAIRIATGTFSAVLNPQIPALGGAGAPAVSSTVQVPGTTGTAGTAGGTGGGGSGGVSAGNGGTGTSGAGAAGTSFSGGPAGGGIRASGASLAADNGDANGGAGGDGANNQGGQGAGGGAGNPGGAGSGTGVSGSSGTGGALVIIVVGQLSGAGTIAANGANGGSLSGGTGGGGAGSGGGSVTILYGVDASTITPAANGGAGGAGSGGGGTGGNGGAGTARKLSL